MDLREKKVRTMAARILTVIESVIDNDITAVKPDIRLGILGSDLHIIRNEILDAAGDTIRAIRDIAPGALTKEELGALLTAKNINNILLIKHPNINVLNGLRYKIGCGVVYNNLYICKDINDLVNRVIPYLDQIYNAKFNIMDGNYNNWRDQICTSYIGNLDIEGKVL